ncbi:MAG: isoprenoid biosynthesis glyoxalase ElbB [Bacteroidales bacterium]|jgi:enhancing lycopene biosynthesis protein 2|nr:isoprenoid biosynthesis glyoxalase ElbB [Bacteroidales bacterium]MDD2205203.1 isoprenoid biosynthesis glyoxalase ElbB [Bacteroidales bacterium]MDD3151905.1 isoprenoid biosynthesis glyoxalase ElbB [Bacteroidales bacterium]MDD3914654.1 isoprenoid biosynthesis glyoxalase ElbB [Bacteroidales bacterium]MDD4634499.1 isoprenoid biosynthesis glyoxalase ElbB [Bacteroidales bacterium]
MKKFAIILSGCGVKDGSEIHEAVMTMYAIKKAGANYSIFAPNIDFHEVNHVTMKITDNIRNTFVESARIARGDVKPLKDFNSDDFDALVIPGGTGAVKNLCNYASAGLDFEVNDDVKTAVLSMHKAGKPIGAECIAPVLIAKIIPGSVLTIGSDSKTAVDIENLDCEHSFTDSGEVCIDRDNNIFTTACYMQDADIAEIGISTQNLIDAILESIV